MPRNNALLKFHSTQNFLLLNQVLKEKKNAYLLLETKGVKHGFL